VKWMKIMLENHSQERNKLKKIANGRK